MVCSIHFSVSSLVSAGFALQWKMESKKFPRVFALFLFLTWCNNQIICTNVYTDNKILQQTVAYKTLDQESKHELQEEILSVLGLDHEPAAPTSPSIVSSSGPHYLLDMYNSLLDDQSGNLKVDQSKGPIEFEGEVLSNNLLKAINTSDTIMSFKNQCKQYCFRLA